MKWLIIGLFVIGLAFCGLGYLADSSKDWDNQQAAGLYWLPGLALIAFDAPLAIIYATIKILLI